MVTCDKCNSKLEEGSKFCPNCGNKIFETVFCPNCGEKSSSGFDFCEKCGASMKAEEIEKTEVISEQIIEEPDKAKDTVKKRKSFFSGKKAKIIAGVAVAAILLFIVFTMKPFEPKQLSSLLYIKDNELYFTFLSNVDPFQVTDALLPNSADYVVPDIDDWLELNSCYKIFLFNEDGNIMFYPDKADDEEFSTYYYRKLEADNTNPPPAVKIDSNILAGRDFQISKDGSKVFYIKGHDGRLYFNNLKEKEKIDNDVYSFAIDDNGDCIIYITEDGTIYEKDIKGKAEKEKIDSDSTIEKICDNLNKMLYRKNGSLYLKEKGKDKVKIASDVDFSVSMTNTGEYYYIKSRDFNIKLSDFVEDDLALSDEDISEPIKEDYQTQQLVEGWYSDYYKTVTDWDAYYDAQDRYREKIMRDQLRQMLRNTEKTIENRVLYYNDGKKETLISENVLYAVEMNINNPVLVYTKYNITDINKVKLSEISSEYDVDYLIDYALDESSEVYFALKEVEINTDQTNAETFKTNYSGTSVYYIEDFTVDGGCGNLMEIKISNGKISNPVKIDDEVNGYKFINKSDSFVYFKDVKGPIGDMYMNGKRLATDVYIPNIYCFEDSDTLIFCDDFSHDGESGSAKLMMFKDGKMKKIADDVSSFVAEDENNIAYITNYSAKRGIGDLMLYNGSEKPVEIDYDVMGLIWKYDLLDFETYLFSTYHGYYGW